MIGPWLAVTLAASLATRAAFAQPSANGPVVEVTGPPSPAMWRVTLGRGELWILPAPLALPRGLAWNPLRLEGVLAGARELVTPSAYRLDIVGREPASGRGDLSALPQALRKRLAEAAATLGEDLQRFDGLDPLEAASRLRDDAWRVADLDPAQPDQAVAALARRAGARVRPAADYRVTVRAGVGSLSDQQGADCVAAAIDDAAWIRSHEAQAARAWALGDVRAWLAQSRPAGVARCLDAVPDLAALEGRDLADVVGAARAALEAGGKSVLLTSPDLLLRPGGLLERLRAAGARVEPPTTDR